MKDEKLVIDDEKTNVNPFADPSKLWVSQDYDKRIPDRYIFSTIPVTKPSAQTFFRVHPDPHYNREYYLLYDEEDRETYLVAPQMALLLENHAKEKRLYYCKTKNGSLCLWPVSVSSKNVWSDSAHSVAMDAQRSWVQLLTNKDLGGYYAAVPETVWPDPEWPEFEVADILQKAFQGRYIDDEMHEVVRKLRGAE